MGRMLFLLLGAVLTGCSTMPECQPITVQVPVRVPCIQTVPVKPVSEMDRLTNQATDFQKIQALTVDYISQKQYINALEAVLEGCR